MSEKVEIEINCTSIYHKYEGNSNCNLQKIYKFNLDKNTLISDIIKERIEFYNKCDRKQGHPSFDINKIYLEDSNNEIIPMDIKIGQTNTSLGYRLKYDSSKEHNIDHNEIKLIYILKKSIYKLLSLSEELSNNIYSNIDLTIKYPKKEIDFIIDDKVFNEKLEQHYFNYTTIEQLIKDYTEREYRTKRKFKPIIGIRFYLNDIQIPLHLQLVQAFITDGTTITADGSTEDTIQSLNSQIADKKSIINNYISYIS